MNAAQSLASAMTDLRVALETENDQAAAKLAGKAAESFREIFDTPELCPKELRVRPSGDELAAVERATAEEQGRRATARARRIITEAILDFDKSWADLLTDPYRGEVAAKLLETWAPSQRCEPFIESEYAVTGIYEDLAAAMKAQGSKEFDGLCAVLGKRLVESAIGYVFRVHDMNDAEPAEQEATERRADYYRELARDRGIK